MGLDTDSDSEEPFRAPSEETRIRLSRLFNPSLSLARDALYSRLQKRHRLGRDKQTTSPLES